MFGAEINHRLESATSTELVDLFKSELLTDMNTYERILKEFSDISSQSKFTELNLLTYLLISKLVIFNNLIANKKSK
jgi:hypothetical protein